MAPKGKITRKTLKERKKIIEDRRKIAETKRILKKVVKAGRLPKSVLVSAGISKASSTQQQQQAQVRAKQQTSKQIVRGLIKKQEDNRREIARRRLKQTRASAEDILRTRSLEAKDQFTRLPEKKRFEESRRKFTEGVDIVSGGRITQRRIDKKQDKLNKDIQKFNKKFGNISLTESQFKIVKNEQNILNRRTKSLKVDQTRLFGSKRFIIAESITIQKRPTGTRLKSRLNKEKLIKVWKVPKGN